MPFVAVKFTADFDPALPEVQRFITQVTPGHASFKLQAIQQVVPELDSLVWDATIEMFVGIVYFNTDNYAGISWHDGNGDWDFSAPTADPAVQRAAWKVIRIITDRIFCVPAQTRNGELWKPVTAPYTLTAGEASVFGTGGGGAGGGGWGGMQSSP